MNATFAAQVYAAVTVAACAFQAALAAGMPWGHLAMGGKYPGRFPPALRVAAVVQLALLAALACIVLVRAGVILPAWHEHSTRLVWIAVAVSALSTLANLATPSRWERILWAPVAGAMLVTSVWVALS
jgi:hypothetical protein